METESRAIPLWVRALSLAVALTVVQCIFLGVTGYPVEEWPFVAGVFAVCLLSSGWLVTWTAMMLSKKVYGYSRSVLAELSLDVDVAGRDLSVRGTRMVIVGVVFVLLLVAAVWGLALKILILILQYMAMPSLGIWFPLVADVMFFVGIGGLAFGLSLNCLLCYSVRRLVRHRDSVSSGVGAVFKAVVVGAQAAVLSRTMGFIVRTGTG